MMHLSRRHLLMALAALSACGDDPVDPGPQYSCTPTPVSVDDPHAQAHDPASASIAQAGAIARRFMADHPPQDMGWDWGESVAMYAISELFRVTAEAD